LKKNIFYSILGIIIITGIFMILFFNISLTSLPTTFKIMLDDQIEKDEQLAINNWYTSLSYLLTITVIFMQNPLKKERK